MFTRRSTESTSSANGSTRWTAVCRGAVIKGLNLLDVKSDLKVSVQSRIARASYGTTCNILPWEAEIHDTRDKAWCPIQQDFLAVDQMHWFVKIVSSPQPSWNGATNR
jgi:hypothetical protein